MKNTSDHSHTTPPRIPGVDSQVVLAASEMSDAQKRQPEWVWYENDSMTLGLGRWTNAPNSAPYIRADIVLALLEGLSHAK